MDKNNFSERLRNLRKKACLTQEELAEYVGVHLNTVSRWENDIDTPKTLHTKKLAQALNVTDDELLNGKQETGTWQLRIEVANDFRQEVIDVSKSVPCIASITTTPNGAFLTLGGDYSLWEDKNSFEKQIIKALKNLRGTVIQNGVALGGIKN